MGIIVSGFSNIGKSFLSQKKDINCIDLDTCYFNKIEGWINIYVECLLALKEKYNYVLITTHGSVLNELNKRNIDYYLVYPDKKLKEEYQKRAIERGSNEEFIEGFFQKLDTHVNDCINNKSKYKIVLKSHEYLSDVINNIKL